MKNDAHDIRHQPAYGLSEAARYVGLPAPTLRTWVAGRTDRDRFQPLIRPASREPLQLSFYNLVEAHVLRSLRTAHEVSMPDLRKALAYSEKELGIQRLLLRPELRTTAGEVFLDRYGKLINLTRSGQLAMREMLKRYLQRVEWDRWSFPVRLYPFLATGEQATMPIAIDPKIAFGRPILMRVGVSTAAIADRIDAGESVDGVADDYDLSPDEVQQAVLYARAA
ncbi:DUF433 domain-containing protein [Ramlibacter albus]|uniref:DUF433 domain-containing protein n=1 Tax=Ramlibacter albus TaxID=2079448 RepID=A0A923M6Z7_9BURK|nr:DUF433 domain-containing protein [Ramlibacter albus]